MLAFCEVSLYSNVSGGDIMPETTQDVPAPRSEIAHRYLNAVITFADNVLKHGRDTYGPKQTPLLVDGINVDTLEPPVWRYKEQEWVMSNLASQQNLLRTLVGLSEVTGDTKYRQVAVNAVSYMFDNLQYANGLLPWGGHAFYDALGEKVVGEGPRHELELHYPFYELLWQVNPEVTKRFIEASWSAHVMEWERLDINRHGAFEERLHGDPWDNEYRGGEVPFTGKGLSFIMAGTDLVRAAVWLSHLSGDEKPLIWAKRLAKRYVEARHPETGLGPANFTVVESHRMENQFPQFGGRFTEATVTDIYGDRYRNCAICQLRLGEVFGANAREFLQWAIEDLTARANNGYDEQMNTFAATLIDGTELSPEDIIYPGYVKQRWLEKRKADGEHFLAYALAYKLSRDDLMWRMTRTIGRGLDLGEFGAVPGKPGLPNHQTRVSDPLLIFGLLELYDATGEEAYLKLAVRLGDNVLESRFDKGFFVKSKNHVFAKFDDPTSLALLHLYAAILNLPTRPPEFWASKPYFHCRYDGKGRTYDNHEIYGQFRDED
jgi:pectate lyase